MLSQGAEHPKREFRGAWIHTVGQSRYMEMNRDAMQDYFDQMLDSLQHIGINAVIFQVRPTDRKSTRLNSSHTRPSRMPSSA